MLRPRLGRPVALALLACGLCAPGARGAGPVAVLHWTASGDDGSTGRATRYDIRRSLLPLTPANFYLADTVGGAPLPLAAGTPQSCFVVVPVAGLTYYFALRIADERGNWSLLSNVASYTVPLVDVTDPEFHARDFEPPWPNPASGHARFRIASPERGDAEVSIYDAAGRRVRRLWSGPLEPGRHGLEWNLRDERDSAVAPGLYFVRVRLGTWTRVRTLAVTR